MRQKGHIKFIPHMRPGRPKNPLDRDVHVFCTCDDFKYRWHYALAQQDAADEPTGIGGEAYNEPPNTTNPDKKIALCKHLCAMHDYMIQKKSDLAAHDDYRQNVKAPFLAREKELRQIEKPVKDTLANLRETGECVVNIVSVELAAATRAETRGIASWRAQAPRCCCCRPC